MANKSEPSYFRSGEKRSGAIGVIPTSVPVQLEKATHSLQLIFEPGDENMNGDINQAMLDYRRVTRIK